MNSLAKEDTENLTLKTKKKTEKKKKKEMQRRNFEQKVGNKMK